MTRRNAKKSLILAALMGCSVLSPVEAQQAPLRVQGEDGGGMSIPKVLLPIPNTPAEDDGDNLGNHIATMNLTMGGNTITNMLTNIDDMGSAVNMQTLLEYSKGDNLGNHTATMALNMASNKVVNMADAYEGDDQDGVNIATLKRYLSEIPGDNLGNHIATQKLIMNGQYITMGEFLGYDLETGAPQIGPGMIIAPGKIWGLDWPDGPYHAANKAYVDSRVGEIDLSGVVYTTGDQQIDGVKTFVQQIVARQGVNASNNRIINVADPSADQDAVNLRTMRNAIGAIDLAQNLVISAPYVVRPVATGVNSMAAGNGSSAAGPNGVALGSLAQAGGSSVAIGPSARTSYSSDVILGNAAQNTGDNGNNIVIGTNARSTRGTYAVVLGFNANASSPSTGGASIISIGEGASGSAQHSMAIGPNTRSTAQRALALGSLAAASGNESIAIGRSTAASGSSSIAIGHNAVSSATNAVAIGHDSLADVANTVSVGTASAPRTIVNVADPANPTDAVNLRTLQASMGGLYTAGDGLTLAGNQFSVNATVVRTLGDQTIGGNKTFTSSLAIQADGDKGLTMRTAAGRSITSLVSVDADRSIRLNTHDSAGSIVGALMIRGTDGSIAPMGNAFFNSNDRKIVSLADPTAPQDAVNLRTLQTAISNAYTAGTGIQITGNSISVDNTVVRTVGNQLIDGDKEFVGRLRSSTANRGTVAEYGGDRLFTSGDYFSFYGPSYDVPLLNPDGTPTGTVAPRHFSVGIKAENTSGPNPALTFLINREHVRNRLLGEIMSIEKDRVTVMRDLFMRRAGASDDIPGSNILMEGGRVRNMADPIEPMDAVNLRTLQAAIVSVSGGDNLGNHIALRNINANNFRINNLDLPVSGGDAANKAYVDSLISSIPSATYQAGSGLTLTGNTFAVDATVVRTTGNQTIAGAKSFTSPLTVTNVFNINGSEPSQQQNGLYVADLGTSSGTTLNPTMTAAIMAQISNIRSIGLTVDGNGYLYGFRTHTNTRTYTWESKTRFADRLTTPRTINGVAFDGSANITLPVGGTYTAGDGLTLAGNQFAVNSSVVRTAGDQSIGGVKTFTARVMAAAGISANNQLVQMVADPVSAQDAVNLRTLQAAVAAGGDNLGNHIATRSIDAGNFRVLNVPLPTAGTDAANKDYVDSRVASVVDTNTTYTAGSGLTLTGNTFAVDATVVRTTGNQTIAGAKSFTSPLTVTNVFNINGSDPSQQQNGLYVADLGTSSGTTLNPTMTAAIMAQISNIRSIGLTVDGNGYLYGFRTHTDTRTYTWESKTRFADRLTTPRTINGVAFDGSANITIPVGTTYTAGDGLALTGNQFSVNSSVVRTAGDQSIGGVKTFTARVMAAAGISANNQLVQMVADPVSAQDAVNLRTLQAAVAAGGDNLGNHIATRSIDAGNFRVLNVPLPTAGTDAANKDYVDSRVASVVDTNTTYTAGSGLTLTGNTFAVDATVVRTTGNQTIAGAKSFTSPLTVTNVFNINGSDPSQQQNGLYVADLGTSSGTTLNPTMTAAIMAQISNIRSIGLTVDGNGYLYGFRTHTDARTYTWESKTRFADRLTTPRTINGVAFDGSANITIPVGTASDAKLKENVEPISAESGIDIIRRIEPVTYEFKEDGRHAAGVIAQQLREVMPYAVSETKDGTLVVEYTQMIAPMISAIQSLDDRVTALENAR